MALSIATVSGTSLAASPESALCNAVGDRKVKVLPWEEVSDESTEESIHYRIRDLDIDRDGLPDAVTMTRSRSASHYPADPAEIAIRLSSGDEVIAAAFPVIAVVRRGPQFYVRGVTYPDPPSRTKLIEVLRIERRGLERVCRRNVAWKAWY